MTWLTDLIGFPETSPEAVRAGLVLEGERLRSLANGRVMVCGRLDMPSLAELRARVQALGPARGRLRLREVVADAQALHARPDSAGALFQVASQFNLLEMVGPSVTPEQGISAYIHDRTQGPACAMACAAGTLYRNYFVPLAGQVGQSAQRQIDCLADLGAALGNQAGRLWTMRNGYALPGAAGLAEVAQHLRRSDAAQLDALRQLLRIGLQWQTEVTLPGAGHCVTQVYGSAMPVAYSRLVPAAWTELATLVLEASYEATLCAAVLNARQQGQPQVFLTLLGGGAFGNDSGWILAALQRALQLHADQPLDVAIVSYRQSQPEVARLVAQWRD